MIAVGQFCSIVNRHRIEAEHLTVRADAVDQLLGQQPGAAAEFEHALPRTHAHAIDQAATDLQLTIDRQPLVVRRPRRSAVHRSQGTTASSGPKHRAWSVQTLQLGARQIDSSARSHSCL